MMASMQQRVRGAASVIFVLLLLGMVLLALTALLNMSASGIGDAAAEQDSVDALYLAETGVERVVSRFDGTNCTTLGEAAINLGRGSFTISNGVTTDYLGVTLPANECRVPVTGVVDNSARALDVIVRVGSSGTGVAFDRASAQHANNGSSLKWNHNISFSVTDGLLIVGVGVGLTGGGVPTVTSVTYNGVAMQYYGSIDSGLGGSDVSTGLYYMIAPPTGNHQVLVQVSAKTRIVGASASFSGINQITPLDLAPALGAGNGTLASATVNTAASNYWLVDVLTSRGTASQSATAGQFVQVSNATNGGGNQVQLSLATNGPSSLASQTETWGLGSATQWALAVAVLHAATGSGGVVSWREVVRP